MCSTFVSSRFYILPPDLHFLYDTRDLRISIRSFQVGDKIFPPSSPFLPICTFVRRPAVTLEWPGLEKNLPQTDE